MSAAESLPEELWQLVLTNVPLRERLCSCSTVCSKLHKAAAAVTTQLQLSRGAEQENSAQLYLANHGQHVTSLKASSLVNPLMHLPCANLQQLDVFSCAVQLGPSSSQPGVLRECTGLTQLKLSFYCRVEESDPSLSALAALPKLQDLHLDRIQMCAHADSSAAGTQLLSIPSSLLLLVPNLTSLFLSGLGERMHGCLQQLSSLSCLENLTLRSGPVTTPHFRQLTALTCLELTWCQLEPKILQHSTQLRSITLGMVELISDVPGAEPAAATGMLLSCTARMPCLQHLSLNLEDAEWPEEVSAFTALMASSDLQHLELSNTNLPGGIWQAMFAADHTWPSLKVLKTPEWLFCLEDLNDPDIEPEPDMPECASTAADLARLVSCCPALQRYDVCIKADQQLTALAQLTALRRLDVQGVTAAHMCLLQSLTQLTNLCIKLSAPVAVQDVLGLSALRALEALSIDAGAVPHDGWRGLDFDMVTEDGDDPDVWLQLAKVCASHPECQVLVVEGLLEQVAYQEQELALQQDRSAQQQERIDQQQRQIAQLQEQLAAASAQAGEAAELRGRVQALEGQLQQVMQALQHRRA